MSGLKREGAISRPGLKRELLEALKKWKANSTID